MEIGQYDKIPQGTLLFPSTGRTAIVLALFRPLEPIIQSNTKQVTVSTRFEATENLWKQDELKFTSDE